VVSEDGTGSHINHNNHFVDGTTERIKNSHHKDNSSESLEGSSIEHVSEYEENDMSNHSRNTYNNNNKKLSSNHQLKDANI